MRPGSIAAALLAVTAMSGMRAECAETEARRDRAAKLVASVQRADYEGDREALLKLRKDLAPFATDEKIGSLIQYWRGFAMWRRAMNGFNDGVSPEELQQDLQLALDDFHAALAQDPALIDAKIGAMSCTGLLAYSFGQKNLPRSRELAIETRQLWKEIEAAAPENPRFLWVLGPMLWNIPADRGGGQDKATEAYEKGLESIRKSAPSDDPLTPHWGEPELLMNLAWSDLNRKEPDLEAADKYARAALRMVPYWHYVRDILLKQIAAAKSAQQ